jgi:hypothetical protein
LGPSPKKCESDLPRHCPNGSREFLSEKLVEGCRFHDGFAIRHHGERPLPASVDIGVGKQTIKKILGLYLRGAYAPWRVAGDPPDFVKCLRETFKL